MDNMLQPVPPRSWKEISKIAHQLIYKHYPHLLITPGPFPVIDFFEFHLGSIGFDYEIVEMPINKEAEVDFKSKTIRLSENTYLLLHAGDKRARFTVMHEVGHAILHNSYFSEILSSEKKSIVMHRRSEIPKFKDPECQANVFSACVLMTTIHVTKQYRSGIHYVDWIDMYDVSRPAAENRFNGIDRFL